MLRANSITIILELCIKYALINELIYIVYFITEIARVDMPFVYGTLIKLFV